MSEFQYYLANITILISKNCTYAMGTMLYKIQSPAAHNRFMIELGSCHKYGTQCTTEDSLADSQASHGQHRQSMMQPGGRIYSYQIAIDSAFCRQHYSARGFSSRIRRSVVEILRVNRLGLRSLSFDGASILVDIETPRRIHAGALKQQIEQHLGQFQASSFSLPPGYGQLTSKLKGEHMFEIENDQVTLISSQGHIQEATVNFFNELLAIKQSGVRAAVACEIMEVEQQKEIEVQSALQLFGLHPGSQDSLSIVVRKINEKVSIVISGDQTVVRLTKQKIEKFLHGEDIEMAQKCFSLTAAQLRILQEHDILKGLRARLGFRYKASTQKTLRRHQISNNIALHLLYNPNPCFFPKNTVVVIPRRDDLKLPEGLGRLAKDNLLVEVSQGSSVEQTVRQLINQSELPPARIGVMLPREGRDDFLNKIISNPYISQSNTKIYVLEALDKNEAVQAFDKVSTAHQRYYAIVEDKKMYCQPSVAAQISSARQLGMPRIILSSLENEEATHSVNWLDMAIVHLGTGARSPIQQFEDQYYALIEGRYYQTQIRASDQKTRFAAFEIDLQAMVQKNIYTGESIMIWQEGQEVAHQQEAKDSIQEQQEVQLTIAYPLEEEIDFIWDQIRQKMHKHRKTRQFSLKKIGRKSVQEIMDYCRVNEITATHHNDKLVCESYSELAFVGLQKYLQAHMASSKAVEYPPYWNQEHPADLDIIDVQQGTQQFLQVQSMFRQAPIRRLQRIQNSLLYQKYYSEKVFLGELNGGPVRQSLLFHGTRANDPALIYADKEQSFNINYANKGRYGKGIYFAKNSQYSHSYRYQSKGYSQMFLCLVLTGHSEVYNDSQLYDTSYRDPRGRVKYESVVDSKKEEIFVVFKNRRAYPLYLISYQ